MVVKRLKAIRTITFLTMKGVNNMEKTVDVDLYLKFSNILIKKYGNFKISQELHNKIIRYLAEICEDVEKINGESE